MFYGQGNGFNCCWIIIIILLLFFCCGGELGGCGHHERGCC